MLARRPYSVAELRRALERKFPNRTEIPEALARLRGLGVLDDRKLAEHYASVLAQERRFGRHRIRRELKARLVDYKMIDPAIERAFKETDERELLEQVLAKKVRTLRLPQQALAEGGEAGRGGGGTGRARAGSPGVRAGGGGARCRNPRAGWEFPLERSAEFRHRIGAAGQHPDRRRKGVLLFTSWQNGLPGWSGWRAPFLRERRRSWSECRRYAA